MKISDVLWEAACEISDEREKFTCHAIKYMFGTKYVLGVDEALIFYKKYFYRDGFETFVWFKTTGDNHTDENQNERFFHLLSAYYMAKGMGL